MEEYILEIEKGGEWSIFTEKDLYNDPEMIIDYDFPASNYWRENHPELMEKKVSVKVYLLSEWVHIIESLKRKPDDIFKGTIDGLLDYLEKNAKKFGFFVKDS